MKTNTDKAEKLLEHATVNTGSMVKCKRSTSTMKKGDLV